MEKIKRLRISTQMKNICTILILNLIISCQPDNSINSDKSTVLDNTSDTLILQITVIGKSTMGFSDLSKYEEGITCVVSSVVKGKEVTVKDTFITWETHYYSDTLSAENVKKKMPIGNKYFVYLVPRNEEEIIYRDSLFSHLLNIFDTTQYMNQPFVMQRGNST